MERAARHSAARFAFLQNRNNLAFGKSRFLQDSKRRAGVTPPQHCHNPHYFPIQPQNSELKYRDYGGVNPALLSDFLFKKTRR
jgi:hypothetical protein